MEARLISFASDNTGPAHPRVMEAVRKANSGAAKPYGADPWSIEAKECIRRHFGPDSECFFVSTGTAANVLGMRTVLRPWHSVLCSAQSHAYEDECGAPEALIGAKLEIVPSTDAKLAPKDILPALSRLGTVRFSQPRLISITQPTERGILYTLEEIREIADLAHKHGLFLHMDGARLANAAVALGVDLRVASGDAGVDVLSFGGTKNGLLFGEAIVFFNPALARDLPYVCKQGMQLMAKMRYVSAQFVEYLRDGLWLENARAANAMAALLGRELKKLPQVVLSRPVETNAIFARMRPDHIEDLLKNFFFYDLGPVGEEAGEARESLHEVRFMTGYDTREEDVLRFVKAIAALK